MLGGQGFLWPHSLNICQFIMVIKIEDLWSLLLFVIPTCLEHLSWTQLQDSPLPIPASNHCLLWLEAGISKQPQYYHWTEEKWWFTNISDFMPSCLESNAMPLLLTVHLVFQAPQGRGNIYQPFCWTTAQYDHICTNICRGGQGLTSEGPVNRKGRISVPKGLQTMKHWQKKTEEVTATNCSTRPGITAVLMFNPCRKVDSILICSVSNYQAKNFYFHCCCSGMPGT